MQGNDKGINRVMRGFGKEKKHGCRFPGSHDEG